MRGGQWWSGVGVGIGLLTYRGEYEILRWVDQMWRAWLVLGGELELELELE